jgi:hypothetical protein
MISSPSPTPVLDVAQFCSPGVVSAAVGVVSIKAEFDVLSRSSAGSAIHRQVFQDGNGYGSIGPHCFAAHVLPFYRYARSMHSAECGRARYKALVPTASVVGDSWRWWPRHLDDAEQLRVVDKVFSAFEVSTPEHPEIDCAQYCFVRPLGIFLAHEGKNRVALFRSRGLTHIPAVVSEDDYPEANRVRVFELSGACLAVLDGRHVEHVRAIHLVRELMEAYGVVIEKIWAPEFADLHCVLTELEDLSSKNSFEPFAADMDKLKLDKDCEEAEVEVTLLDIEAIRLPGYRTFLNAGVALVALLAGVQLTAGRWPDLQLILATASGAVGALLVLPLLPLVRCKVKDLKDGDKMGHFFNIRQSREREARQRIKA